MIPERNAQLIKYKAQWTAGPMVSDAAGWPPYIHPRTGIVPATSSNGHDDMIKSSREAGGSKDLPPSHSSLPLLFYLFVFCTLQT